MQTYTYFQAAKCECGFLWTTSADASVICACGAVSISASTVSGAALPFADADLEAAIADDILIEPAALIVERG